MRMRIIKIVTQTNLWVFYFVNISVYKILKKEKNKKDNTESDKVSDEIKINPI